MSGIIERERMVRNKEYIKGYVLALVSVIALSNVYIFSKAALKQVSFYQFGIYWFAFGMFWTLLYVRITGGFHHFKSMTARGGRLLILLGLMDMMSTYFFFKAIHTIANPGIVSFIGNIGPAMVIIMSILLLSERLNDMEVLGVLLALSGAFVISYRGTDSLEGVFLHGSQYILYGSMIGATASVIIKKNIGSELPPVVLTVNRQVFLWLFSLVGLLWSGESLSLPIQAMKNIAVGSLLGPFLTAITGFLALQYIPLSHKAVIGSLKGVFVLLGSLLFFGLFPATRELAGGAVSILGVLLISFGKMEKG